jgi:hypothetical protein
VSELEGDGIMSRQKSPEYRAVKNYIINTEKITRKEIFEIVRKHIERIVEQELKGILNSSWLRQQILNTIINIAKDGFADRYYFSSPQTLEDFIKEEIRRILKNDLLQKYEVVVKEKEDGKS